MLAEIDELIQRTMTYNQPPPPGFDSIKATEKAQELLMRHLNAKQQKEYLASHTFPVKGANRTYSVGPAGVSILTGKYKGHSLCVGPADRSLPVADKMLALKLWIEANEAGFLAVANPMWNGYCQLGLKEELLPKHGHVPVNPPAPVAYHWQFANANEARYINTTTTITTDNTGR